MDRVSEETQPGTGPDTGGWKPTWDIGMDAGRHTADTQLKLRDLAAADSGADLDRPLYVRVNGTLAAVRDYSIMPRRGITVLELDQ